MFPSIAQWTLLPVMMVSAPRHLRARRYYNNPAVELLLELPDSLPQHSRDQVDLKVAELTREGFTRAAVIRVSGMMNADTTMYLTALEHRTSRHAAMVTLVDVKTTPQLPLDAPVIQFETGVPGTFVTVNNSRRPSMFGIGWSPPGYAFLPFMPEQDAPSLYRVFREFVRTVGPGPCRLRPEPWVEQVRINVRQQFAWWQQYGFITPCGEAEFRNTAWANLRAGWGFIPVIARLRFRREQAHFMRRRRRLGIA